MSVTDDPNQTVPLSHLAGLRNKQKRFTVFHHFAVSSLTICAAGTCGSLLSSCGVSTASAQSAMSIQHVRAAEQPGLIALPQNSAATPALLHQANASYHAHDWFGALSDYQQLYYLDPDHGNSADRGLGNFVQAQMSLCHTWTGVNALEQGDYATSKSEATAALDDNSGNTVAQRLLTRTNQQYHLLTAVEDVRQPMGELGDAPNQQVALDSIQASSARSNALLARLTKGTSKQEKAAFRFLEAYNDAFATNFLLTHNVASQEAVTQDIALGPIQHAPSDEEILYDVEQMVNAYPEINDMGRAVFASDDIAEAAQYQPVLDAERNQLEEDNEAVESDPTGEENFLWETRHQEGRSAEMRMRQLFLDTKRLEAQNEMNR